MRTPRRSRVVVSRYEDQLNPLQYMWWMLTSDYTILIYSLVFIILITLDLVLHAMGIGGH